MLDYDRNTRVSNQSPDLSPNSHLEFYSYIFQKLTNTLPNYSKFIYFGCWNVIFPLCNYCSLINIYFFNKPKKNTPMMLNHHLYLKLFALEAIAQSFDVLHNFILLKIAIVLFFTLTSKVSHLFTTLFIYIKRSCICIFTNIFTAPKPFYCYCSDFSEVNLPRCYSIFIDFL